MKATKGKIKDLKPDARNANLHSEFGMQLLNKSVEQSGFGRSILISNDDEIIAGNGVTEVAADRGLEDTIVVETDGTKLVVVKRTDIKSGTQEFYNLALADNITAQKNIVMDATVVDAIAVDYPTTTEWGQYIDRKPPVQNSNNEDEELLTDIQTDIKAGDLFEIGIHRLLCGDCTKQENVDLLMNNKRANLVFTDPPYNKNFNGRKRKSGFRHDVIDNDNLSAEEFEVFIKKFLTVLKDLESPEVYVCCSFPLAILLWQNFEFKQELILCKNHISMGYGYRMQHELCLYKGDLKSTTESTLWEFNKEMVYSQKYKVPVFDYLTPTQKPVSIPAKAVYNSSKEGDVVVDLFGGSGSTMIACEEQKRRCFTMELNVKTCQIIVNRVIKAFPELVVKKNGVDYVPYLPQAGN